MIHRNFVDIINAGTDHGESYNIVERKREIFQRNIDGLNVTDTLMTMLSNTMSDVIQDIYPDLLFLLNNMLDVNNAHDLNFDRVVQR